MVDDAPTDGTAARLGEHAPDVRLERLESHSGFAVAANRGIGLTRSPFVALLNVDTRADSDWLRHLVEQLSAAPRAVGFAASMMLQLAAPDLIDSAGDCFSRYGSALKRGRGRQADEWERQERVLSACAGAALYRRQMLDEIGRFDETFGSYLEDVDLGLRAALAGYECLFVPAARVLHQGGGSALPRAEYVRRMTANRAATVLHCLPSSLLLRHCLRLLWGQFYFFVAYARPWSSLQGYGDLLRRLPAVLRRRQAIQSRRRLPDEALDSLLERELGEPSLLRLLRRRLSQR
jgi:GT2 family glycosyltransferase